MTISSKIGQATAFISQKTNRLFLWCVIVPTALAGFYYGLVASNIYISESKYIVYSPQSSVSTGGGGLQQLLQGVGVSGDSYGVYAVHDYLLSRDALRQLQAGLDVSKMYSGHGADFINRFGGLMYLSETFEDLFQFYTSHVTDDIDASSNISTLTVRAFTPQDSQRINAQLLALGQQLIDKLNQQADEKTEAFYQGEVAKAEAGLQKASQEKAAFQNNSALFNPTSQSTLEYQILGRLQNELIQDQLKLAQMLALTPSNPQIDSLKKQISSLQTQIDKQSAAVTGAPNSLASKSVTFERLTLNQSFAESELAAAMTSLEQARIRLQKQQLFIETVVSPNLPDESMQPKRLRNTLAVFILGLLVWGVLSIIVAGVREHHG